MEWERGCGSGDGEMSVQSTGEMVKDFCPNVFQPFLKTLTEGPVRTEAGN